MGNRYYVTMWTCKKCGLTVQTRQKNPDSFVGWGKPSGGYCRADGYGHDWEEAIAGQYEYDD